MSEQCPTAEPFNQSCQHQCSAGIPTTSTPSPQPDDAVNNYGPCHGWNGSVQCVCPGFEGGSYSNWACTRLGCGHHYDEHW